MEEFNKKFKDLVASIHSDFKPPDKSILVYYMEALSEEMRYHLKDKEPDTLKKAKELAIKIDLNMQSTGKSNIPGFTRALTKPHESKDKAPNHDAHEKKMRDLTEKMEAMDANLVDQLKLMQNRLINMEKAQPNHKNFPPKGSWVQKKTYHQDNRPPNQLESANMVEEIFPYRVFYMML